MAKELNIRGTCSLCGDPCYIECAACFAILLYHDQDHHCPENCTETVEICDHCDEANDLGKTD